MSRGRAVQHGDTRPVCIPVVTLTGPTAALRVIVRLGLVSNWIPFSVNVSLSFICIWSGLFQRTRETCVAKNIISQATSDKTASENQIPYIFPPC